VTGRVLIVGAGGVGGPLAYAVTAAGAAVTVCDDDRVDLSNLQRQVQFTGADLGRPKVEALGDELRRRGVASDRLRLVPRRFEPTSAGELAGDADVLVDGSDDPATKFAVADWAMDHRRPYVIAGVLRWGGTVFRGGPDAACYRCLFEAPPDDAPTCADAGVVGAACAAIGGLAAQAALAFLTGDLRLAGTALVVEDLRAGFAPRAVSLSPRAGCPTCARTPLPAIAGVS